MFNKLYEIFKKIIKENYKFILVLVIIWSLFFINLPYVVYRPGGTVDLSDRIIIDDSYEYSGKLSLVYVSMMKGNIPNILLSFLLPNWDLVKTSNITLDDESVDEVVARDKLYLANGQDNAIINAYKLAGKEVEIIKNNQVVIYIAKESDTDLQIGDIILSIDDKEINSLDELKNYVETLKINDEVTFKVLRNEEEMICKGKVFDLEGSKKIGISLVSKYDYETVPKIEIKNKDSEAGSSGGLMTALSIYNSLVREDITKGKNIVGTGSIDENGNILEIGGVKYKVLAAEKKHADIFLCPEDNYEEAMKVKEDKNLSLVIIKVSTLEDAVDALKNVDI